MKRQAHLAMEVLLRKQLRCTEIPSDVPQTVPGRQHVPLAEGAHMDEGGGLS